MRYGRIGRPGGFGRSDAGDGRRPTFGGVPRGSPQVRDAYGRQSGGLVFSIGPPASRPQSIGKSLLSDRRSTRPHGRLYRRRRESDAGYGCFQSGLAGLVTFAPDV